MNSANWGWAHWAARECTFPEDMHSADLSPQLQLWSGALLVVRIIIIIRLDLDLFLDLKAVFPKRVLINWVHDRHFFVGFLFSLHHTQLEALE